MDGKLLARVGAAVFVGLAFAMTLVQLREEPHMRPEARTGLRLPHDDPLPEQLRACAGMGEAALSAPECRAAWAEKRRRFLGVDYPDAYSRLNDPAPPLGAGNAAPSRVGERRGAD
jgi:conjugative transfer region protein TrbK